jgi:glycosyltransferase involved in cell wall biosynthesis
VSHNAPVVSVVTPVYNGEPYLTECIESVLGQSYEPFEYLIVDNQSTDHTLEIARAYERRDERVRVLAPPEFVSGDANANRALRAIDPNATYVKVVHADDWIYTDCTSRMVALAEEHPSVGVVASFRRIDETVRPAKPPAIAVLPGRDVCRSTLLGGPYDYLFGSPTSLLLRADLVRARPEFYNVENPFDADVEACLDVLRACDFGFVHEVLTYTRRHEGAESSYFFRNGAQQPAAVERLLRFGPVYLEQDEYQRKLAVLVAEYVRFVALHPWRLRNAEFRAFHSDAARRLAPGVRMGDLARGAVRQAVVSGRRIGRAVRTA